ncbi:MAG TPA: NADH-quinone oxidoreductase subunit C [Mycobacteriales bacterium]
MADEHDPASASQVPADEDPTATPDPATGQTHGGDEPATEASPTETVTDDSRPNAEPPSGSASVAAETAPAQSTQGSSNEVDTVPAPEPEAPVYRTGMFGVQGTGDTSGYGRLQRRVPVTAGAQPPFGGWFDDAHATLAAVVPSWDEAVENVTLDRGELTYHVRRESLLDMLRGLRDDPSLRFELLSMVGGVHYPDDPSGRPLHSVYQLTSLTYRRRLRVEVAVSDADPHLPSAVEIYPTADWQEREAYDMFGLVYDEHPGLTRILMPDDWEGHPQRKDYPLGGIPVTYKGASIPPPDTRRVYS